MPSLHGWTWRGKAAVAALGAVAGLMALGGTASAAQGPSTPAPGTNLIHNGNFSKPKVATHEGAVPTGWKAVDLGAEKKPFNDAIGIYNAKGKFPPPAGNPNKSDIACEDFYEGGTATGVEGFGAQQTSTTFGSITQANNPQVSFSNVETLAPEAKVANWAGNGLQFDFTSGKKSFTLIYFSPWKASVGTFKSKPANTATTKYILGPTLTLKKWNTWKTRSLNKDIKAQFKLSSYKVTSVTFANIEDTTSPNTPFPNETSFFTDLSVTEGS
jgi:hypothetical protein